MAGDRQQKSGIRHIVSILLRVCCLLFAVAAYFAIAFYFRDHFMPNTWFEGIYCTGSSVESVASQMKRAVSPPTMELCFEDTSNPLTFSLEGIEYTYDFEEEVRLALQSQNPYKWPFSLLKRTDLDPVPKFSFNESLLRKKWEEVPQVAKELSTEVAFAIEYSPEKGFSLINTKLHRFQTEEGFEALKQAVHDGEAQILFGQGFFADVAMTEEEISLRSLWRELSWYLSCDLIYDMGAEKIYFDNATMSDFLEIKDGLPILDEYGRLVISEEKVSEFIGELCEAYNTHEKVRKFPATRGEIVEVVGGTYEGTELNAEAEEEFLMTNLLDAYYHDGLTDVHIPEYTIEGYVRGLDDIGDTYIEVDLTAQKLYAYKNGSLLLTSDVVSGNHGKNTPVGTHYIYFKQKDRVLVGENYRTPVKYWMAFVNHVGLHDATWRNKFGGNIYLTNGSHGCVNLPLDVAAELYDNYEVGTPVIVFF